MAPSSLKPLCSTPPHFLSPLWFLSFPQQRWQNSHGGDGQLCTGCWKSKRSAVMVRLKHHSSSASKYSKNHLQCRISRLSPHSHSLRSKENMGNGRKSKSNYFGHQPHPCQIQVCNPEQFALQPRTAHTEHLTYFWPVSTLFLTDVSRRQKAIPFQKTKFWQSDFFSGERAPKSSQKAVQETA